MRPDYQMSQLDVLEAEAIGGQAGSSSLIRNYPGFSRGVSGADR